MHVRAGLWAAAAVIASAGPAAAGMMTVTVDAKAGPWEYAAGLNEAFEFGLGDHSDPVVLTAADGIDFSPAGSFTISFLGGFAKHRLGGAEADGTGDPHDLTNDSWDNMHGACPVVYAEETDDPVYVNALMAVFADDRGAIVGTPVVVGNWRVLTAPAGATRLQIGLNDNLFADNSGSLSVGVFAPFGQVQANPEPASVALVGVGGLGLAALRRRLTRG